MVKTRGCANCGNKRVAGSTLCEVCLDACHLKLQRRMVELEVESRRNLTNLAMVVKEQKERIELLEYIVNIRTKLYQAIFKEYQELLMAVGEESCKKRVG